jgi:ribosomal protein L11 methyltransferase
MQVLEMVPPRVAAGVLTELLPEFDPLFTSWEDEETGSIRFERYCTAEREAEEVKNRLVKFLEENGMDPDLWNLRIRPLPDRDWAEAWKEFFHAERVSPRIVVKPTWETYGALPGDCVVEIDPGMSFGTGRHATTRACLIMLDELADKPAGMSFLDLGCGSGILSIAAAKLGFGTVTAVDNDPAAIACTRENAAANGVGDRVRSLVADISTWRPGRTFDVAAANVLAPVLTENAGRIAGMVSNTAGSGLIVAGILTGQHEAVAAAYDAAGFRVARSRTDAEWTSSLLTPGPTDRAASTGPR